MHFRIYTLLLCAFLLEFAAAAQSDITFHDDADIEGSGNGGEVTHDLGESSGSGSGPPEDDEDTPEHPSKPGTTTTYLPPREPHPIPEKTTIVPTIDQTVRTHQDRKLPESAENPRVEIMNPKTEDRPASFFAQPGILAAVIGGAVVGLLCAILVVMFIVYRMRKKDEGSYALGEPKQSPTQNSYSRGTKEFYA
ncbi:unnamed protein product [Brassicogethes aeneus]|uniref:Syndecan n=1 Tax=Brassicogethes aeneus TaxID=1431903 RepID=A0A9P0FMY2_BRAAE|nr:unnamed protein product [Brassicogethes aeneus]